MPITEAQKAFWNRVNEDGGIGGYDIDVTKYVKDNKYNPQTHNQVYQEIKPDILALAQTLGSPTTAAILDDLDAEQHRRGAGGVDLALPVRGRDPGVRRRTTASSRMNGVDYAVENSTSKTVMAVHYAG